MSTSEKNTEELLYKSHSLGIKDEVFGLSKKLREQRPYPRFQWCNRKGI